MDWEKFNAFVKQLAQEVSREFGNIIPVIAQRRHRHRQHVQTKIQVLAKASGGNIGFEIAVAARFGTGREADVLAWAQGWHALGSKPFPSEEYNAALQALTDKFAGRGAAAKRRLHGAFLRRPRCTLPCSRSAPRCTRSIWRAWPMFRRYRPGHLPWFLEAADVQILTTVLEQTLEVAPRVRADASLVWPPGQGQFLVRTRSAGARWVDRVERVVPPAAPTFAVDPAVLERLGRLPRRPVALEADIFRLPGAVQDGDGPPFLVYAAMLVDAASGVIVGAQLLEPRPALDRMLDRITTTVASMLLAAGMVPAEVRVRSDRAVAMLEPLAAAGFALRQAQKLPALDTARTAMAESLAR